MQLILEVHLILIPSTLWRIVDLEESPRKWALATNACVRKCSPNRQLLRSRKQTKIPLPPEGYAVAHQLFSVAVHLSQQPAAHANRTRTISSWERACTMKQLPCMNASLGCSELISGIAINAICAPAFQVVSVRPLQLLPGHTTLQRPDRQILESPVSNLASSVVDNIQSVVSPVLLPHATFKPPLLPAMINSPSVA